MLKIAELAERSGVSTGTIKHYLREGLLGPGDEIMRTSRNMAWYPPELVERIRLIKQLQEDRYMPLRAIREVLAAREGAPTPRAEVEARHALPGNVLDRLEELGIVTTGPGGYRPDDVAILAAIARFRAGGYEESIGFTVYDTLRYREALEPLVREEVRVLLERLAGEVAPERAAEIVAAGAEPLRDLVGAMHSKLLLAELERTRGPPHGVRVCVAIRDWGPASGGHLAASGTPYSLYLVHLALFTEIATLAPGTRLARPAFAFLVLVGIPISLALAELSWHLVERPALRLRLRLGVRGAAGAPRAALLSARRS